MENTKLLKNKYSPLVLALLFLILIIASNILGCLPHYDGPYKGKVVDANAGEPIEGAVVAAHWVIEPFVHSERTCDAKETITDKNGEFELPEGRCTSHPFAELYKPYVVVFKPGYLGYPPLGATQEGKKAKMPDFTGLEFKDEKQYYIIKLGRPKTRQEREFTQSHAQSPLIDETISKLPILIRLVNEERNNLGLDEVYKKGVKNEK
jgi:hypothetical protein